MNNAKTRSTRRGDEETIPLFSPRLTVPAASISFHLPPQGRRRLTNLLIGKLLLEALFVCALAVTFHFLAFHPFFRGWLDHADAQTVWGWAVDAAQPAARVEVQLYIDGRFVASRLADDARPDVLAARHANDERHGFVFATPPLAPGEHEARVYVVHESARGTRRTMQQLGAPKRFRVEAASRAEAHRQASRRDENIE